VDLDTYGPLLEQNEIFPEKANIEFIQVISPKETKFRVWERGAGQTLACGTGACASVVAGVLTGRNEREVTVHLPGGDLQISWDEDDNHVSMAGPAFQVFKGEVLL
jgi:diaminopimelate epimerase